MTQRVRLTLPSSASYLAIARVVAAAAAGRAGLADDVVDDVRLAVSEAVALAVSAQDEPVAIEFGYEAAALQVAISPAPPSGGSPADDVAFALLTALVPVLEFTGNDRIGRAVVLRWPTSPH